MLWVLDIRGCVYTVARDKWIYGERRFVERCGYDVEEAILFMGFAKTYILVGEGEHAAKPKPLGQKLEIVPTIVKRFTSGEAVNVQVLYNSKPVRVLLTHASDKKKKENITTDENGSAKIVLEKGVNILVTRYSDESLKLEDAYDRTSFTTTLSLIAL